MCNFKFHGNFKTILGIRNILSTCTTTLQCENVFDFHWYQYCKHCDLLSIFAVEENAKFHFKIIANKDGRTLNLEPSPKLPAAFPPLGC